MALPSRGVPSTLILVMTITGFLLIPAVSTSQWNPDPAWNTPVCTMPGDQTHPRMTADGQGGAIIAWFDEGGTSLCLQAQRLSSSGFPLWQAGGVLVDSEVVMDDWWGGFDTPHVVILPDDSGGAVIVYMKDAADQLTGRDVFAQRVAANGTLAWQPGGVPVSSSPTTPGPPRAVKLSTGETAVVWWDLSLNDVYAQVIDRDGNFHFSQNGMRVNSIAGTAGYCGVVTSDSGRFIPVWYDTRTGGVGEYVQKLSATGARLWDSVDVFVDAEAGCMGASADGAGGIITVERQSAGLVLRRVSSDGSVAWNPEGVVIGGTAMNCAPVFLNNEAGGTVIVWPAGDHILGQRVDLQGARLWGSAPRIISPGGSGMGASIGTDGNNGAVVVFLTQSGALRAQRVSESGTLLWPADGILVSTTQTLMSCAAVFSVPNLAGGTIFAFERTSAQGLPEADIYAGLVNGDGSPGGSTLWNSTIHIEDGCGHSGTLTFGLSPLATNQIDPGLGENDLPPAPPSGIFDCRFNLPVVPERASLRDFRNDALSAALWTLAFQPGACGYPIVFRWNGAGLPEGAFRLTDETGGAVIDIDMHSQDSLVLTTPAITRLRIDYKRSHCAPIATTGGWNLVAVPLNDSVMSVQYVFGGHVGSAFHFEPGTGYVEDSILVPGRGYWIHPDTTAVYTLCGSVAVTDIPVASGWNLVGCFDGELDTGAVATSPPGIVESRYYSFDEGYEIVQRLVPGKGFWVRTRMAGVLHLGGTLEQAPSQPTPSQVTTQTILTFRDNRNTSRKLYFTRSAETGTDLPPTPPGRIMDVRFADGKQTHPWTDDQHRVLLTSAQDPVTLTVTGLGDARLSVDLDGRLIEVREGVPISLRTRGNALVLRTSASNAVLPERFALLPNYPNPFNPVTTFTFDLARPARSCLGIYDLLGQEVRVLFDESMPAGRHSIPWDASGLPSGVYLCRLTAGENTATQRILLLK